MDCEFSNTVCLFGFLFVRNVHFNRSIFGNGANFSGSIFRAGCYLVDTRLAGLDASTSKMMYGDFERTEIKGISVFRSCVFGSCSFGNAKLHDNSTFFGVRVDGSAVFDSCKFLSEADFRRTSFNGLATFRKVSFLREACFDGAVFERRTNWAEVVFYGDTQNDTIAPMFKASVFREPVNFTQTFFRNYYPDFSGAILHDVVNFSPEKTLWPLKPKGDPEQAQASCAVIRNSVKQQGLPEAEHFFFRSEMAALSQIGTRSERIPYQFFGLISSYGHSIGRPTIGLFILWFIPMLCYMIYFNWIAAFGGMEGQNVGMFDSVSLSFTSMFKFLGLQRLHFGADYIQALPPFLELFTAFQTLSGIILLFFLGLGLRTRFRLR